MGGLKVSLLVLHCVDSYSTLIRWHQCDSKSSMGQRFSLETCYESYFQTQR